jgi:hypothetical protein
MKTQINRPKKKCVGYIVNITCFFLMPALLLLAAPGKSVAGLKWNDKEIKLSGYINQGVSFGLSGDHADTIDGLQQAPFQALLETRYAIEDNLRLFVSGKISTDWAYDFLSGSSDWSKRRFKESRDRLYFFDEWDDILNEAHLTWTPGNFNIRIGKQIVLWGEMDNVPVTSIIMPKDGRRGVTDQEFEAFFRPITLVKGDYYFPISEDWLNDLGIELIFNPNVAFVPSEGAEFGREVSGIWAPRANAGPGAIIGAYSSNIKEPNSFDSDGFEYGIRVKALMLDTLIQLMGFYGIDNDPVSLVTGSDVTFAPDGFVEINLFDEGYYARQRMVGMSCSREFPVSVALLGDIRPVIRLETSYFFNNTYMDFNQTRLYEKDEFRWGVGFDWKIKINWLNPKAFFVVTPEFVHHEILDAEKTLASGPTGDFVQQPILMNEYLHDKSDYWNLYITTSYWHTKILPFAFYQYESKAESHFLLCGITYERDSHWNFTLQTVFLHGDNDSPVSASKGYNSKDNISFTTSYRF